MVNLCLKCQATQQIINEKLADFDPGDNADDRCYVMYREAVNKAHPLCYTCSQRVQYAVKELSPRIRALNQQNALNQQFNFNALSHFKPAKQNDHRSNSILMFVLAVAILSIAYYYHDYALTSVPAESVLSDSSLLPVSNVQSIDVFNQTLMTETFKKEFEMITFDLDQEHHSKCFESVHPEKEEDEIIFEQINTNQAEADESPVVDVHAPFSNTSAHVLPLSLKPKIRPAPEKNIVTDRVTKDERNIPNLDHFTFSATAELLELDGLQINNEKKEETKIKQMPKSAYIYDEDDWFFMKAFKVIKRGYEIDMARHKYDAEIYERWKMDHQ